MLQCTVLESGLWAFPASGRSTTVQPGLLLTVPQTSLYCMRVPLRMVWLYGDNRADNFGLASFFSFISVVIEDSFW